VDVRARQIVRFSLRGERYEAGRVFEENDILTSEVLADLRLAVAEFLPRP
jgi:hypothetical protein